MPRHSAARTALGIALAYLLVAGVLFLGVNPALLQALESATTTRIPHIVLDGSLVFLSACLIFVLVHVAQTRQSRVHDAHLRVEQDLNGVLESVSDAAWTIALPSRHITWRGRWRDLTGHPPDALPTVDDWLERIHPDDRRGMERRLDTLIGGAERALVYEHRLCAADGSWLWVRAQARAIPSGDDGGDRPDVRVIVGTYTDLTAARRQEERLSVLAHDLAEVRGDLESLASAAAHDLRQPVREVVSYGQLLRRRLGDDQDPDTAEYLAYMIKAARHLDGLLNGLAQAVATTRAPVSFAPVDLKALLSERVRAQSSALEAAKGTAQVGDLPVILGGYDQLTLLFDSLLSNAIKFRHADRPLKVEVEADRDGPWWRVIVADNGIGLPPTQAEKAFQSFRRLHGRGQYDGAGMGLAVCRSIAAHHGGSIAVEGSGEDGARMVVRLPAMPTADGGALIN